MLLAGVGDPSPEDLRPMGSVSRAEGTGWVWGVAPRDALVASPRPGWCLGRLCLPRKLSLGSPLLSLYLRSLKHLSGTSLASMTKCGHAEQVVRERARTFEETWHFRGSESQPWSRDAPGWGVCCLKVTLLRARCVSWLACCPVSPSVQWVIGSDAL